MKRMHYSWYTCIIGTIMLFCTVGLTSSMLSIYIPYIITLNDFSSSQAGYLLTIRSITSTITVMFVDQYLNLVKPRKASLIGLGLVAAGFVFFSIGGSYFAYCVGAFCFGLGYTGAGLVVTSVIMYRWFNANRSLAVSIASCGSGLTTIIMPPIITLIIEKRGVPFGFMFLAVFVIVCALVSFMVLRDSPESIGLKPYDKDFGKRKSIRGYGNNMSGMMRVVVVFACAMTSFHGFTNLSFNASLYKEFGMDSYKVSFVVSASGVALVIAKLVYGRIADAFGGYKSLLIFSGIAILGNVLGCFAPIGSFLLAVIASFCAGAGLTLSSVGFTVVAQDFSDKEHFSKNLKWCQGAGSFGGIITGIIVGRVRDILGSYIYCWYIAVAASVFAAAIMIISYKINSRGTISH